MAGQARGSGRRAQAPVHMGGGRNRIRPAIPSDFTFIRRLAVRVFSYLGDYGRIIPDWLAHDGVLSFVVEEGGRSAGFSMIGYYRIEGDARGYAADLLAIAVSPEAQHQGLGRRLLEHAIATARTSRRRLPVRELRLSVAEPNQRARRLFASAGFVDVPGDHGVYEGGQRALHMRLKF
jgi:ribosomal protein S18 acetylase RimI-like enzyme